MKIKINKIFSTLISALAIIALAFLVSCVKNSTEKETKSLVIKPMVITENVQYDTDDPAIWINPQDPAKSLIPQQPSKSFKLAKSFALSAVAPK